MTETYIAKANLFTVNILKDPNNNIRHSFKGVNLHFLELATGQQSTSATNDYKQLTKGYKTYSLVSY